MAKVNGMVVQSDGSKPHVKFIMHVLAERFPYSIWKIGGKVKRKTWGGGFSRHSVGLACDIYLDAYDRLDLALGDRLVSMFIYYAEELLVRETIWNHNTWSKNILSMVPEPYTGSGGAHTNHIHVSFERNRSGKMSLQILEVTKDVMINFSNSSTEAAHRADGLHGKAFDPQKPLVRLTKEQRNKITLEKKELIGI